jgi:hypothetical protein
MQSNGSEAEPARQCRRFGLLDAMILIAATAQSLAFARTSYNMVFDHGFGQVFSMSRQHVRIAFLAAPIGVLTVFLDTWIPSYLLLRLRQPRPTLRQIAFQPGVVACESLFLMWIATASERLVFSWLPALASTVAFTLAIPVGWTILASTGGWRPEVGWIERLGRFLGVCWIVRSGFRVMLDFRI